MPSYAPWLTIAIHPSGPRLTFYIQLWTRMAVGGAPPPSLAATCLQASSTRLSKWSTAAWGSYDANHVRAAAVAAAAIVHRCRATSASEILRHGICAREARGGGRCHPRGDLPRGRRHLEAMPEGSGYPRGYPEAALTVASLTAVCAAVAEAAPAAPAWWDGRWRPRLQSCFRGR